MEDPFGKSQERPKVFRITSVVLLKDWGTKDLRVSFTFELLVAHRGAFNYCLAAVLGFFSPISKSHGRNNDEGQACFLKYPGGVKYVNPGHESLVVKYRGISSIGTTLASILFSAHLYKQAIS